MSLATEIAKFARSRPAFWTPIANFYSIAGSPTPPTDNRILAALCYGDSPQNLTENPKLVWNGPFDYDQGTTAQGAVETKSAKFWFTVYANYLDDAMDWMDAIETDVLDLFTPVHYETLTTVRIMSMIYIPGTKLPVKSDQAARTGKEFAMDAVTICYKIVWQSLT